MASHITDILEANLAGWNEIDVKQNHKQNQFYHYKIPTYLIKYPFQKISVETFCPGTLEIEFEDGRKWKTSFPNKRVSKTELAKLNFVGEYNNEIKYLKSVIVHVHQVTQVFAKNGR